jgi:hypothetical protein
LLLPDLKAAFAIFLIMDADPAGSEIHRALHFRFFAYEIGFDFGKQEASAYPARAAAIVDRP